MKRAKTIFCDIDGTLIHHTGDVIEQYKNVPKLLDGTIDKMREWDKLGYNIILTTGRKECMRSATIKQLENIGIIYDQLIMGIGGGPRIIINDRKDNSDEDTCFSYNIKRNEGIKNLNI